MDLVILSGKGGTGKTTVATALASLIDQKIAIDADVDAPNFQLFYQGEVIKENSFSGGSTAVIDENKCLECGICGEQCHYEAIDMGKINPLLCEGCGSCVIVCPSRALSLESQVTAHMTTEKLQDGWLVKANMEVGSDGSGKLVTELRKMGKEIEKQPLTIIDGSPGIGCPVVASITGSQYVLLVTEPTQSGLRDLNRILTLCRHFKVKAMVCINKYDLHQETTEEIKESLAQQKVDMVGLIPFDKQVQIAINNLQPITEYKDSAASRAIVAMWQNIKDIINSKEEVL